MRLLVVRQIKLHDGREAQVFASEMEESKKQHARKGQRDVRSNLAN